MKLVNVVITGKFSKAINLTSIDGCIYRPEKFSGGIYDHRGCTFLLFANGSFVCVGAPSKRIAVSAIKSLGNLFKSKIINYTTKNMVMSDNVGFKLNMVDLYEYLRQEKICVTFEDELFSGITWKRDGGTIRLFHTGRFFVAGLRNVRSLINVCSYVREVCKSFKK